MKKTSLFNYHTGWSKHRVNMIGEPIELTNKKKLKKTMSVSKCEQVWDGLSADEVATSN